MGRKHKPKNPGELNERKLLDSDREESKEPSKFDPLLALVGSGRDLWANEHADEYVNHLREGWE